MDIRKDVGLPIVLFGELSLHVRLMPAGRATVEVGGGIGNIAIALAYLGTQNSVVFGVVGRDSDSAASWIVDCLARLQIGVFPLRDQNAASSLVVIDERSIPEQVFISQGPATIAVDWEQFELPAECIGFAQYFPPLEVAVASLARRIPLYLDIGHAGSVGKYERLCALVRSAPPARFLQMSGAGLSTSEREALLALAVAERYAHVVITAGANQIIGCSVPSKPFTIGVEAIEALRTIGAGDIFAAHTLKALAAGATFREACVIGAKAATHYCEKGADW